jgi:hypothetical protein
MTPRSPATSLVTFLVRATVLVALLGAIAWFVVGAVVSADARRVVLVAAAVAWGGAALGRLAGLLVPGGRPEAPAQAALVALGVRLMVTAAACWVALEAGVSPVPAFVAVLGGLYLALLVLEVGQAAAEVRSASADTAAPRHGGSDTAR